MAPKETDSSRAALQKSSAVSVYLLYRVCCRRSGRIRLCPRDQNRPNRRRRSHRQRNSLSTSPYSGNPSLYCVRWDAAKNDNNAPVTPPPPLHPTPNPNPIATISVMEFPCWLCVVNFCNKDSTRKNNETQTKIQSQSSTKQVKHSEIIFGKCDYPPTTTTTTTEHFVANDTDFASFLRWKLVGLMRPLCTV